ncbi:hypothetical protein [Pelagibacterium sp. H642]|uniref:hypothetical protein n=1 Tax=Pelagibacterium sp. H642 TaxID=1881069 RepID=UPI0028166F89|nr:hypothetical protein [Pelagibacterium sp. H642]WMT92751.1 hypothetical protein NO934_18305 [Pelagibacterium sp. H642]
MLDSYPGANNLLGTGDPNVCLFDGRWRMYLGGFHRGFKNNLFEATLPSGEGPAETTDWTFTKQEGDPNSAKMLVPQPQKGAWDHFGLHEPCHVVGSDRSGMNTVRRIYYTGRASSETTGTEGRFSIGFLEWSATGWRRHPEPVMSGRGEMRSALGPKVIYAEGKWRMWFRMVPHEPAKGIPPRSQIFYSESADGVTGWSEPVAFSEEAELFSHAFVGRLEDGYCMVLTPVPNLHEEDGYPPQQILLSFSASPSGHRKDWSEPVPVLDASGGPDWCADGFFGSSVVETDGALEIFFTGVARHRKWLARAFERILHLRKPPIPAPYFFSIGRVTVARDGPVVSGSYAVVASASGHSP